MKLRIPDAENLKFWGIVALFIVGVQGYMWVDTGVLIPDDIYEENVYGLTIVPGDHYITVYTASDYVSAGIHEDGDPYWSNINRYAGHDVNINFHFDRVACDMVYLMKIEGNEQFKIGNSSIERWAGYMKNISENSIKIFDVRHKLATNDNDLGVVHVPENNDSDSWWYIVCFARHMIGSTTAGDYYNPGAKLLMTIMAVT